MNSFSLYDTVRVVRLNSLERSFDGTEGVSRPPKVGDIGTIVFKGDEDFFIVESSNEEGFTVWLADFHRSEIELVESQSLS